jgi:hypothetical protein
MQVTDETRRILEKAGLSAPGLKGSVLQSDASQFQANLLKSQDRVILWSRYIELISIYYLTNNLQANILKSQYRVVLGTGSIRALCTHTYTYIYIYIYIHIHTHIHIHKQI